MRTYLLLIVVAGLITYLSVPFVRWLAIRVGAITAVRDRDVHTEPTPRMGGVAMYIGMAAALLVASQMPFLADTFADSNVIWWVLASAGLVCALGVADDIWDLDWMTKLIGQILSAGVMAWAGVQFITMPIGGLTIASSRLSLFVTILVVIVAINAVNFVDGLDGLAAGLIAIGGGAFLLYTYVLAQNASPGNYANVASVIMATLVGVCLGFLPYNFSPAKIFMGDSGAMLIGLTMAGASIIVTGQIDPEIVSQRESIPAFIPIVLPLAVLLIPLLDMGMAVIRRLLAGKSPFAADRKHLHHRLLALGHSKRRVVIILYLWTSVFAFSAVAFVRFDTMTVLSITLVGSLVALLLTLGPLRSRRRRKVG